MAEPRARLLSLATLHEPHPFGQHASICPPNRAALLLWSAQAVPLASAISKTARRPVRDKACERQDKRGGGRTRLPRRLAKLDEAGTFARTARQGWLKQVKEARITAATVSWSLRASAAIASLVGKLPLEASLRLRAESSAAFLAVGLRCFAQSFARYTLRHFTEREVVPNASVRQVLLHAPVVLIRASP